MSRHSYEESDTLSLDPPASMTERDMVTRNQAEPATVDEARAAMKAEPNADYAVIPMCWPGKEMGWWRHGQRVETVPMHILAVKGWEGRDGLPSYAAARNIASAAGRAWLNGREGVAGWACVRRGEDHVPVFEGDEVEAVPCPQRDAEGRVCIYRKGHDLGDFPHRFSGITADSPAELDEEGERLAAEERADYNS